MDFTDNIKLLHCESQNSSLITSKIIKNHYVQEYCQQYKLFSTQSLIKNLILFK